MEVSVSTTPCCIPDGHACLCTNHTHTHRLRKPKRSSGLMRLPPMVPFLAPDLLQAPGWRVEREGIPP